LTKEGVGGMPARTTDEGATWQLDEPEREYVAHGFHIGPSRYAWIAGGSTNYTREVVLRTSDSGLTWRAVLDTIPVGRFADGLFSMAGFNDRVLVAGGYTAGLWRSVDGGDSWDYIGGGLTPNDQITGVAISDSVTYWATSSLGTTMRYEATSTSAIDIEKPADDVRVTADGSFVTVWARDSRAARYALFDVEGRTRMCGTLLGNSSKSRITLASLPLGTYLFVVDAGGRRHSTLVSHWNQ
jgi:hypothetical protein